MRIRPSLTAGAIATVAAIAFAVPGIAGAANSPAPGTAADAAVTAARAAVVTSPPSIPRVAFNHSPDHMTSGKVAGIIAARGKTSQKTAGIVKQDIGVHAEAAAPTACTEPNCNLPYNGGPVQHTPHVYLVFWGPNWDTDATANYLFDFFTALGSKSDGWTPIVEQYTDTTGHPTINGSLMAPTSAAIDDTAPPNPVDDNALGTEAADAASFFNIADPRNADIVIVSQSGTCFAPPDPTQPTFTFAGNCGTPQPTGYCAYHNWDVSTTDASLYLPWVNLPYQPDAGAGCGAGFVNTPGTLDGFSVSGGHEVTEAITDPIGTGWFDAADTVSGGEVADKCAWGGANWNQSPPDPKGNLTVGGETFAVQSLWSNARSACVLYAGLTLSVTTPATQSSTIGTAITPLQINATVGGDTPLTYTATGLPPGLSINKTTGAISGTPGVTAGTFTTRVTVAYYYSSKTVSFAWKVASTQGNIKGWASKCVADYQAKTTAGARIVLWPCAATASMNITFGSNNQLSVVGRCITGTTTVFIEPCSAAGAKWQHWTRLANGEYVLQSNGKCLTAPGQTNGLQLVMAACKNAGNQRWSLP
jgi:membrane-bound inhibitor of C-type lysozyme